MNKQAIIVRGITKGGGVERFVKNILIEIDKLAEEDQNIKIEVVCDKSYYFFKKIKNLSIVELGGRSKLFWDYVRLFIHLRKSKYHSILFPKNIIPPVCYFTHGKKINIIHDLGYFKKELNAYKKIDSWYMQLLMGQSCRKSNRILAISDHTKREIINQFGINENKVVVVSEAVEDEFRIVDDEQILSEVREKYYLKVPFILYPGSISPRKNISRILEAFNNIKDDIPHMLYFTGARGWKNKEIWKYINDNHLNERVKKIGYVEDRELPALYNLADLCLYPSLYEGFGLPILEAQACGCPVLTSNVSSLPEVAGKGAHIVDPYSTEEIKNGMKRILNDENYRTEIVENGLDNIRRFSWKKTSEKLLSKLK